MSDSTLGLFAKQPAPGRCKTRLAAALGAEWAARFAAASLADTVDRFERVADRRLLAYAPATDAARAGFEQLAAERYELWPQPEGTLGERLAAFFAEICRDGSRTAVIGADTPTLPLEFVSEAFAQLENRDCVLGPAQDGGYYLIALRAPRPELFHGIAWGSAHVLDQTLVKLRASGLTWELLPLWHDVDTIEDLAFLRSTALGNAASGGAAAHRTAAWLKACDRLPPGVRFE